jgi:hypothetical protein
MDIQQLQVEYDTHIRPEIDELVAEVDVAVMANPAIQPFYQGWRVFFGPVIAQPKVLLIGINPGNGQAGIKDIEFWGNELQFEYTEYNYTLARETREAFAAVGLTEVLVQATMKTNYCFLSTTQANELEQLTDGLGQAADGEEHLGAKVYRKSDEWTRRLVDLINPSTILCEGKTAYEWVRRLFPEPSSEESWDSAKECGFTVFPTLGFSLLGYSRRQSTIRNKAALSDLLRRFVKP